MYASECQQVVALIFQRLAQWTNADQIEVLTLAQFVNDEVEQLQERRQIGAGQSKVLSTC